MFWKKKKTESMETKNFDPAVYKPVLRCSICNGEQVAGFKNRQTGQFEEVMCIKSEHDLETFKTKYGITEIAKEY